MKQRLLLTIVALLAGVQAWAMVFEVDGLLYWPYDETDEVYVYPDLYSGDVVIPSSVTYEGTTYRVTSIGEGAFSGCSGLTSVVIPSSVTSIGNRAFSGCSSLTYNEYDNGLYLGNTENPYLLLVKAKNADITSCLIHSSTKSIHSSAFKDCSSLTSVVIPSGVTVIGSYAFINCSSLTSVTIPSSVNYMFYEFLTSPFSGCNVTRIDFTGSLEEWCNKQWDPTYISSSYDLYINGKKVEEGKIPSGVTEIGGIFRGCSSLISVEIPSSVTEIGSYAFKGCSSLTSVTVSSCVINMSNYSETAPFKDCNVTRIDFTGSLEEWCNKQWDPTCISSSYDLYINGNKVEGELVIPSSVTWIGGRAFYGCSGLTSVEIPSGVTSIGDYAFAACSSLTSVTIPSSVNYMGSYSGAFPFVWCNVTRIDYTGSLEEWCNKQWDLSGMYNSYDLYISGKKVEELVIPSGVTEISRGAFYGCSSLTSVTIPSTVTVIGYNAFPSPYDEYGDPNEECKLNTITLLTKTNQPALAILGDYTDSYFHSKGYAAVYVADGLLPFYEWFWGGFYNFIEIGDVPSVINGEGGIASIVKVYNNKVDINVDLEEGYSVSEIKVNGNVVYPASSGNKALSADVSVIKNSETSFTLVGVTADDTIEVAYNKSTPTPVGVIEMQREVKGIYDIYGRKLSAPQRGINIIDGKKVIVK